MGLKLGHSKEYFLYVGNKQPGNSVGLTAMDGNCIVGGLALDEEVHTATCWGCSAHDSWGAEEEGYSYPIML